MRHGLSSVCSLKFQLILSFFWHFLKNVTAAATDRDAVWEKTLISMWLGWSCGTPKVSAVNRLVSLETWIWICCHLVPRGTYFCSIISKSHCIFNKEIGKFPTGLVRTTKRIMGLNYLVIQIANSSPVTITRAHNVPCEWILCLPPPNSLSFDLGLTTYWEVFYTSNSKPSRQDCFWVL